MKFAIRLASYSQGKPCDSATRVAGTEGCDWCFPCWEVEVANLEDLLGLRDEAGHPLIIEQDGGILVYDDFIE
jgi:hypothetical protein